MNNNNLSFSFFIPGRLPGMNEIIKASKQTGKGLGYYRMKKTVSKRICRSIEKELTPNNKNIKQPIDVKITWIEPNKRRDPDNIAAGVKFIYDSLVSTGVIVNDGWKDINSWSNEFLVANKDLKEGVVVEIFTL